MKMAGNLPDHLSRSSHPQGEKRYPFRQPVPPKGLRRLTEALPSDHAGLSRSLWKLGLPRFPEVALGPKVSSRKAPPQGRPSGGGRPSPELPPLRPAWNPGLPHGSPETARLPLGRHADQESPALWQETFPPPGDGRPLKTASLRTLFRKRGRLRRRAFRTNGLSRPSFRPPNLLPTQLKKPGGASPLETDADPALSCTVEIIAPLSFALQVKNEVIVKFLVYNIFIFSQNAHSLSTDFSTGRNYLSKNLI